MTTARTSSPSEPFAARAFGLARPLVSRHRREAPLTQSTMTHARQDTLVRWIYSQEPLRGCAPGFLANLASSAESLGIARAPRACQRGMACPPPSRPSPEAGPAQAALRVDPNRERVETEFEFPRPSPPYAALAVGLDSFLYDYDQRAHSQRAQCSQAARPIRGALDEAGREFRACAFSAKHLARSPAERASADKHFKEKWFNWLLEIPPPTTGTPNKACCAPPQIPSVKVQSMQQLRRCDLVDTI
jgi:hypothetical protein